MNLSSIRQFLSSAYIIMIALLLGATFLKIQALLYAMFALIAVYIVVYAFLWRCPKCKKHLGKTNVCRCGKCGYEL